jgi:toxin FitB
MNVVDSCGWLEYMAGGENAGFFETALLSERTLIIPSIVVFEVYKRLTVLGHKQGAESFLSVVQRCVIAHLEPAQMASAAKASMLYKIAMADAIIWQTAQVYQASLFTQEADLQNLPGVRYQAKPVAKLLNKTSKTKK